MIKRTDGSKRKELNLIDIGSGTGLVGVELYKNGFTCVDALDPSDAMIKASRDKGVYRNLFEGKCMRLLNTDGVIVLLF